MFLKFPLALLSPRPHTVLVLPTMPTLPTVALTAARARVSECEAAYTEAEAHKAREAASLQGEGFDPEQTYDRLFRLEDAAGDALVALDTAREALETLEDAAENAAEDHWHAVQNRLCA